jgi:hypothetical protein
VEESAPWDRERIIESPWFAGLRDLLAQLPATRFPTRDELNALAREGNVVTGGGAPLSFVPPTEGRSEFDRQYELRIFDLGEVETRAENWHDLLNALAWLAYPRTKATLNRLHRAEILQRRGEKLRGTARDVLTLFDEGGIIVACADSGLAELLRGFRWQELFWARRADVAAAMRFFVFGHAILERALAPYKAVTAKALIFDVDSNEIAAPNLTSLDARAARYFARPEALASTRALHPLPVLGIPGWTPENECASFYHDESVFRSGRTAREARAPAPREGSPQ